MKTKSFHWNKKKGWDVPSFPKLDPGARDALVIVFADPALGEGNGPVEDLVRAYPETKIIGCSSAGEIRGAEVYEGTVTAALLEFEATEIQIAYAPVENAELSEAAGRTLAFSLDRPDLKAIFVLSDGLGVNGSDLAHSISSIVPASVAVTGGLAGDGTRFQKTWVIKDGKPQAGMISAVGFYGSKIRVGYGSWGGWDIFGPERVITSSRGNVLFELDHKPALQIYKEYLGDRAAGLPATALLFPLSLRQQKSDAHRLVRTILAVDEKDQSMTFAGTIPQGVYAQLMSANFERVIDGANEAAKKALVTSKSPESGSGDRLAIAVSCVGRKLVLGERTEEECEATLDSFQDGTHQIGFYSYGELCPHGPGQDCELHNQSMTITLIYEA